MVEQHPILAMLAESPYEKALDYARIFVQQFRDEHGPNGWARSGKYQRADLERTAVGAAVLNDEEQKWKSEGITWDAIATPRKGEELRKEIYGYVGAGPKDDLLPKYNINAVVSAAMEAGQPAIIASALRVTNSGSKGFSEPTGIMRDWFGVKNATNPRENKIAYAVRNPETGGYDLFAKQSREGVADSRSGSSSDCPLQRGVSLATATDFVGRFSKQVDADKWTRIDDFETGGIGGFGGGTVKAWKCGKGKERSAAWNEVVASVLGREATPHAVTAKEALCLSPAAPTL